VYDATYYEQRNRGLSWSEVLVDLREQGASRLDLLRVVRQIEGTGVGEATRLVDRSGAVPVAKLQVALDEADPFYEQLFPDEFDPQTAGDN
jgi:ribosomal protein L7/L12